MRSFISIGVYLVTIRTRLLIRTSMFVRFGPKIGFVSKFGQKNGFVQECSYKKRGSFKNVRTFTLKLDIINMHMIIGMNEELL